MQMDVVFTAEDDDGNGHEVVLKRDLDSETPKEGTDNGTLSIQDAVQGLVTEADRKLARAGLKIPDDHRTRVHMELCIALLNGRDEVHLPAAFASDEPDDEPGEDPPEREEE